MAGGGTGAFGGPGVKPTTPKPVVITNTTRANNFSTWGTTPQVKFTADQFQMAPSGGYMWAGNKGEGIEVAFIGDKNGKYVAQPNPNLEIYDPLSPINLDSAVSREIANRMATPGAITALKKIMLEKQMYQREEFARASLSQGDGPDGYFMQALRDSLSGATMTNAINSSQGSKIVMSLDDYLSQVTPAGLWAGSGGGGSGGTRKTISRQKFSPQDYDIAIDELFQQTLGRGASEEELNNFVSALQKFENKNPEVTVSKTSGNTTRTTTSGGVSGQGAMAMMKEQALAQPEAENYNKATKYLNYFRDALASPIELGK
jgi:hypothetical protein